MITKTEVRRSNVGSKKGWCFDVYFNNKHYPNIISALWKTKKTAATELARYIKTGKFSTYGDAE
jgi:hypothetical protein